MATIYPTDPVKVSVKCSARDDWIRFVTCWEITAGDTTIAIEKILFVLKELEAANKNGRNTTTNSSEKLEKAYIQTQAALEAQNKKSKL